jgi:hypothetical protein
MRQLKIDFSELELAFESGGDMLSFYLDLETGEIISVSEEDQSLMTSITRSYTDEQTKVIDWEKAFQEEGIADWLQEELQKAAQVEADTNNRFLAIPTESSREGYREMEDFIATVSDPRLQERLGGAISGQGAFRNFKNMLLNYPAERQRWFQFKRDRLHQYILDWLDEQGIEPIP